MQEMPMLFPMETSEFLKKLKVMIEETVEAKMNQGPAISSELSNKTLLKPEEICQIFRVSKATLYVWIKQGRLKSFKVRSRRYFARTDIEAVLRRQRIPFDG